MSALDARIRHIAREELASAEGGATADSPLPAVAELEKRLDALIVRVDELAKAVGDRARRTPRKTASEPGE